MPQVRLSDETYKRLERWLSVVDGTADGAVQRLLDIAELGRSGASGERLPRAAYYEPILAVLRRLGGSAKTGQVGNRMADHLTAADRELLPSGGPQWKKEVNFAALHLSR